MKKNLFLIIGLSVLMTQVQAADCDSCASCQNLLDSGEKDIRLISDISDTEDCIIVNSQDHIKLDCQGKHIYGNEEYASNGIIVYNAANTTIRNCEVSGYGIGIAVDSCSYTKVEYNYAHDNGNEGIGIWRSDGTRVDGNEMTSNWWGLSFYQSTNNLILDNTMCNNTAYDLRVRYSTVNMTKNTCDTVYTLDSQGVTQCQSECAGGEMPDYFISDIWEDGGIINYKIGNNGSITAPKGHYTYLYIDGNKVGEHLVEEEIEPQQTKEYMFDIEWICSPPQDKIEACADETDAIKELREENNCLMEIWECTATDEDGDGYTSDVDCDDNNASIYPGAEETCNDVDDNCDGEIDENFGLKGGLCARGTGECIGYGEFICNEAGDGVTCDAIEGDPEPEICDGLDNDCDGLTDEEGACAGDFDGDGIPDEIDNCVDIINPDQIDEDMDGIGNGCDMCWEIPKPTQNDFDGDCEPFYAPYFRFDPKCGDVCDNCPEHYNPFLGEDDGDVFCVTGPETCFPPGCGGPLLPCDYCTPGPTICIPNPDGIGDPCDNCPTVANHDQADSDQNCTGVFCVDSPDGVGDVCDNCPDAYNPGQEDTDGDGVGDACDNCRYVNNPGQWDTELVPDCALISTPYLEDPHCGDACDNCPYSYNPGQEDTDVTVTCSGGLCIAILNPDGVGDVCDNCPDDYNPGQDNSDGDDHGDECDNCAYIENNGQEDTGDVYAYYKLDETEGTDVPDVANGFDGTVGGQYPDWVPGFMGNTLNFNMQRFIETPLTIDSSENSNGLTMMAWVKPSSTIHDNTYVMGLGDYDLGWSLLQNRNKWTIVTGDSRYETNVSADAYGWQHLAVVFIPGSGVELYKNGTRKEFIPEIGYYNDELTCYIGKDAPLPYHMYDGFYGLIDEVAVFDGIVPSEVIYQHYVSGRDNESLTFNGDGLGDACDLCPYTYSENGVDTDGDGMQNPCDNDDDNDGCVDYDDANPLTDSFDWDGDGLGEDCDEDNDDDLCPDAIDPLPYNYSWDYDSDGRGSDCDDDDDGDGCLDVVDPFPIHPGVDHDGDGIATDCDNCHTVVNPDQRDTDGDGDGDNCDCDDGIRSDIEIGVDCGGGYCFDCPEPKCIPYLINGDTEHRIDLVFIPDDDYGGNVTLPVWHNDSSVTSFMDDIEDKIRRYNMTEVISDNIGLFNFYFSTEEGEAADGGSAPADFWTDCPFADAYEVLHVMSFTDRTRNNHFSAEGYPTQAHVHETGHGVFGLKDEYNDTGRGCVTSYSQNDPNPNIWDTQAACRADAASEGGVGDWDPDNCTFYTACQGGWWKLDKFDVMVRGLPRDGFGVACARRINWVFDETVAGVRATGAYGLGHEAGEAPKSMVVYLNINNDVITELESEVVVGYSPNNIPKWNEVNMKLLSLENGTLDVYGLWDPRVDLIEQGPINVSPLDNVNFTVVFPYYPGLGRVEFYENATGKPLGSVDLRSAVSDFCSGIDFNDPDCQIIDLDGDGVLDMEDLCPFSSIPESIPTRELRVNRFALTDADTIFDTIAPKGKGPEGNFTTEDTFGCSCEQILDWLTTNYPAKYTNMEGHIKFGCSIGVMKDFIELN